MIVVIRMSPKTAPEQPDAEPTEEQKDALSKLFSDARIALAEQDPSFSEKPDEVLLKEFEDLVQWREENEPAINLGVFADLVFEGGAKLAPDSPDLDDALTNTDGNKLLTVLQEASRCFAENEQKLNMAIIAEKVLEIRECIMGRCNHPHILEAIIQKLFA